MNTLTETLQAINLITDIGVADIVDILIVAFLVFHLFRIIERTDNIRVAVGIIILLLLLWLSGVLRLTMINFFLNRALELGTIALVILFQPELRRGLEKMGNGRQLLSFFVGGDYASFSVEGAITQTVMACGDMSRSHTGALILFTRDNQLSEIISTGTVLDATVSSELLKNIFFVKAPLHDGAVILKDGRVAAAGCILPNSGNMNLSKELGTRHRAGIGISERSDAVVVIVSEETGAISLAIDGMLKRHLSVETLETLLRQELLPGDSDQKRQNLWDRIRSKVNGVRHGKE